MGEGQHDARPPEIGWDELTTRLAARRGTQVHGDRVSLWARPRYRLRMLVLALAVAGLVVTMWSPSLRAGSVQTPVLYTLVGVVAVAWAGREALRRGPVVIVDERGVTRGRLHVRWADVQLIEFRADRRHTGALLVVDPRGPSVTEQPWWRRRWLLRRAFRHSVWGARVPLADTRSLPLAPDEVGALSAHPAFRRQSGEARRPDWAEETGKLVGRPDVVVEGDRLVVSDRRGERLRIDGEGVHGRLPVRQRSVPWHEIWDVGLSSAGHKSALVLHLVPEARVEPVTERGWAGWASTLYQPSAAVPLRGLPFDAVGLTGLLFAHPGGEALWRRMTTR